MKSKKRNWRQYNKSLIQRGSLTFWVHKDLLRTWHAEKIPHKKGRPFLFSDTAILTATILRFVFRQSLRATEGLICSVFHMLGLPLRAPGYTVICKRMSGIVIPDRFTKKRIETLVLDASGLKVFGEGEWKVKKYGASKRREWKKLHIGMDAETQEIVVSDITESGVSDTCFFSKWVKGKRIKEVLMDGAADASRCYAHAEKEGVILKTPPQKNAVLRKEPWMRKRNEAILQIKGFGGDKIARDLWRYCTGYTRRALVESTFSR